MSLVEITDFDEALALLGLYEQEVMKTGVLDYPAQWPEFLSSPADPPPEIPEPIEEKVEPREEIPTEAIAKSPPAAKSLPPLPPSVSVDNVDNLTVIVNEVPEIPPQPDDAPEMLPPAPEPAAMLEMPELTYDARREALLEEQEKERRLFYLFVQELEGTGDLRKLPTVLHSPSRS
ncbi:hypothetical protein IQE94_12080 [Synechocystis sp. PCC 7339]|uniref:hypothetical protein n=1 Tax=Synechocystis sp. PCC 7339 TaxID=2782213 RepID=UPI001CBDB11A|nr:hypothetical protein [Synechocystis sp. PCC 7339]UAJ71860.1 hypothetical protein IQE94_12080 [Synechocystis sp. PCC 7339]